MATRLPCSEVPLKSRAFVRTPELDAFENAMNSLLERRRIFAERSERAPSFLLNRVDLDGAQLLGVAQTPTVHTVSDPLDAVHVIVPVAGAIESVISKRRYAARPGQALVFSPTDSLDVYVKGDSVAFLAWISSAQINRYFSDALEMSPHAPIKFDRVQDVEEGVGLSFRNTLSYICKETKNPNSLLNRGISLKSSRELLLSSLLHGLRHSYSDQLEKNITAPRPAFLRRAVDYIHEHLSEEVALVDLVAHSGVSLRSLQKGFVSSYGVGPMTFINNCKLDRIRKELLGSENEDLKIGDIAAKWGFYHTSNFARKYAKRFGELPSETLRR